jgi:hypothetical protein
MYSGTNFQNLDNREGNEGPVDRDKVERRVDALMRIYGDDQSNLFLQGLQAYIAGENPAYQKDFESRFMGWTPAEVDLFIVMYSEAHRNHHENPNSVHENAREISLTLFYTLNNFEKPEELDAKKRPNAVNLSPPPHSYSSDVDERPLVELNANNVDQRPLVELDAKNVEEESQEL